MTEESSGGVGEAGFSALLILWSATTVLVEAPTGVLADRFSRRRLLIAGPCVTATGFALWTAIPSFASFAAGFVLWAIGGSLQSGTMQALVYDELDALGAAADYARLSGRMRAASAVGLIAGTAAAAPLYAWYGYCAVGATSVLACGLGAAAAAFLPETRGGSRGESSECGDDGARDARGWRDIVGSARGDLRGRPVVRRLLVLVVALTGISALDEYLPLLVGALLGDGGRPDGTALTAGGAATPQAVALLMAVIAVGDIAGALAAGRFRRPSAITPAVAVAALVLVVSTLSPHPGAAVGVAVAFAIFGWALVVADAALQDALDSVSRATVTSVAGVGEELVAVSAFAAWALGSQWLSPPELFALAAMPYLLASGIGSAAMTVSASRR